MSKEANGKMIEWERLTALLLYGVSRIRKMPLPDKNVTLYDDLIEAGATVQEAGFLISRAKRLGIETK